MKRLTASAVGLAAAVTLFLAPSASAATEFGSNCNSNGATAGLVASLGHGAGSPLPIAAPSGGVITRWKSTTELELPPEGIYTQQLQVLRPTTIPNQFLKVGESAFQSLSKGVNTFPTRIPIQSGDRLGLAGGFLVVYCETGDVGDVMGLSPTEGGFPLGGAALFSPNPGYQVPAAAIIEPDVDNDGYGDETQDGCPQSAAYQTPCPVITLATFSQAGAKAVTVSVTTSLSAPVQVRGTVKLDKKTTAKLGPVTAGVAPGTIGKLKLQFPASLRKRLKELEPKQKLTLKLTASAANITGPASTSSLNAKLKGQG